MAYDHGVGLDGRQIVKPMRRVRTNGKCAEWPYEELL